MIYEFQLVGGREVIERYFPASDCPELGSLITDGGKRYRRILSAPQISADVANIVHKYPYESMSLPRGEGVEKYCDLSPRGRPIVRSRQHEREIMAVTGRVRD